MGEPDTRLDTRTFEALYQQYYDTLLRVAYGYLGSSDAARDVVADVFVRLWRQQEKWPPAGSIEAYLVAAARNAALNELRNATRRSAALARAALEAQSPASSRASETPEEALVANDRLRMLWQAIDTLPPARRLAMILRWQQQLSFDEIAQVMGISTNAVQLHLSRALAMLRKALPDLLR